MKRNRGFWLYSSIISGSTFFVLFVHDLWKMSNEDKTSFMANFYFTLLFLDLIQFLAIGLIFVLMIRDFFDNEKSSQK